jgi:acetylglutamate kinase
VPEFFDRPPLAVYVDEHYRGAAIVLTGGAAPYLSKFAVEPQAQGEGMGNDLWQALARDFSRLFWRTRHDNPILPWYLGLADGMARTARWYILWRGIDAARIPEVMVEAEALPPDFATPG